MATVADAVSVSGIGGSFYLQHRRTSEAITGMMTKSISRSYYTTGVKGRPTDVNRERLSWFEEVYDHRLKP